MAETAVRVIIEGRVQGVGYRIWTEREARQRRLRGWVRNRDDGTVEALFAGEETEVRGMIEACRQGPRMASVTHIQEFPATPPPGPGFGQMW
jgi:acylphosphatase